MKFQPKAIFLGILLHRYSSSVFAAFEIEDDADIFSVSVKKFSNAGKVMGKAVNDVVHHTGTDGDGNGIPITITSNLILPPQSPRRRRQTSQDRIMYALNEAVASGKVDSFELLSCFYDALIIHLTQ
jgi:hypothetical protein